MAENNGLDFFKFAHENYKMDSIGGLQQMADFIKGGGLDLIKDLNLNEKVIFLGRVSWSDMPKIYSSAIMTLIPSLGVEGTSLSALESMASATATISTDRGGLSDLPTVHCQANELSLFDSMKEVYKNYKQIGQQQQNSVQKNFNLIKWKNAWLNVVFSRQK